MTPIEIMEYRLKELGKERARRARDLTFLHLKEALRLMKTDHDYDSANRFKSDLLKIIAEAQDL